MGAVLLLATRHRLTVSRYNPRCPRERSRLRRVPKAGSCLRSSGTRTREGRSRGEEGTIVCVGGGGNYVCATIIWEQALF